MQSAIMLMSITILMWSCIVLCICLFVCRILMMLKFIPDLIISLHWLLYTSCCIHFSWTSYIYYILYQILNLQSKNHSQHWRVKFPTYHRILTYCFRSCTRCGNSRHSNMYIWSQCTDFRNSTKFEPLSWEHYIIPTILCYSYGQFLWLSGRKKKEPHFTYLGFNIIDWCPWKLRKRRSQLGRVFIICSKPTGNG